MTSPIGKFDFKDKQTRDFVCKAKDTVVQPIVRSIDLSTPENVTALLMPSLYGPTVDFLLSNGVPPHNIFCVERQSSVWKEMTEPKRIDRQSRLGLLSTTFPTLASKGVGQAFYENSPYDLVFMDYFGHPTYEEHFLFLQRLFSWNMLKSKALLLLIFGNTRCRKDTKRVNSILLNKFNYKPHEIGKAYIKSALGVSGHIKPLELKEYPYISSEGTNKTITYTVTVARW